MNLRMRFIGEAKTLFDSAGHSDQQSSARIDAFAIQTGDYVTHPLFPDRTLVCKGRRVDFVAEEVVLLLDLLENPPTHESEGNVVPLKPR